MTVVGVGAVAGLVFSFKFFAADFTLKERHSYFTKQTAVTQIIFSYM